MNTLHIYYLLPLTVRNMYFMYYRLQLAVTKNITESLSELDSNYSIIEPDHLDKLILDFIQSDNKFYVGIGKTFQLLSSKIIDWDNHLEKKDNNLKLTKKGYFIADEIILDFTNSYIQDS